VPRGRFLGREVSTSERLASCSGPSPDKSRLLWTWSMPWADRDGRLPGSVAVLRALVVPMLDWSLDDTEAAIADLESVGLVLRYQDEAGRKVLELWNFAAHQQGMKYDREAPSKYGPNPDGSGEVRTKSEVVRPKYKSKSKFKSKSKSKSRGAPAAPTKRGSRLDDSWSPSAAHELLASELGLDLADQANRFRDYWLAEPGGKASKLDWSRAFNNWLRRAGDFKPRKRVNSNLAADLFAAADRLERGGQ